MVDLTREEIDALLNTLSTPGYRPAVANRATDAIIQLMRQLDAETARADAAAGQMREIIPLAKRAVDQDKSIARERGWNEIDIAKRFANQDTVIRCAESALPLHEEPKP